MLDSAAGVLTAVSLVCWALHALLWLAACLDSDVVQHAKRQAGEGWFYGPLED